MRALALITVAALALAFALGGTAPLGRALLSLGVPHLAATVFGSQDWGGVAQFRAGDFDKATAAFAAAENLYNLGTAQAWNGEYAAALESLDQARLQGFPNAQANFDVLAAFYAGLGVDPEALGLFPKRDTDGPRKDGFVARGEARAAGTGSDVTNTNTMLGLAELDSRGRLGVRRVFDDKFIVADERWLEQLPDVPGSYLQARIAEEYKRRRKLGLSPPEPEDPR
jgi:Ca-activated chloride channel family protein